MSTRMHGRLALQVFAFTVAAGVMAVSVVAPNMPQTAQAGADASATPDADVAQSISVASVAALQPLGRDSFQAERYVPPPPPKVSTGAPAAGSPDPGSAKAIAYDMVAARGWGVDQYDCLVALWNKESGWNTFAHNPSSGAYGIPQSLPGSKMASAGADWATNPATQITWGLGYIQGRYGTPCGAWGASQAKGWY
ncbi:MULTISPECIES: transglycosylase SLT domain-containing protein [unclassified Salinibacterium]|uniref:aggregation-promoting factor C-terminal-like domain-containing protein n=1 Tax=unclassified Salinibacterium TaxID=2632331 RepID=UPI001F0EAC42|nr:MULTISPECIES: transglycosylase SLT domain-containing protein [unclassified Salinibacterium]